MNMELLTTIQKIETKPGQRLLVISDVHGHFNRLVQLLRKMNYGGDDILILVGDLVDKGPESLRTVQYVMDLCRQHQVYVSMGNVDYDRVRRILNTAEEEREGFPGFLQWSERVWGGGMAVEMLSELGVRVQQVTAENALEYKEKMNERFREELEFLWTRPTILTAGNYLFVHGGVPTDDLSQLEGQPAFDILKVNAFLSRGYCFENYTVVTGHWPTCLYRKEYEDGSPLFEKERNILCIDGGCGVKISGQLNGIIIPDSGAKMEEISWTSYDDFPVVTALEAQEEVPASLHIQYLDSDVELLEEMGELCKIRHFSTGRELVVPKKWIYHGQKNRQCDDCCDRVLPIKPGDSLSVVFETEGRRYVKNNGESGWYQGAVKPMSTGLKLVQGAPEQKENWRRQRELAVYELLDSLDIVYERIDHCEANTMEACKAVDELLDGVICKNLFLCNSQRTCFYLLMMPEGKKFKTKELSKQINSARLSFAEAIYMEDFLHISPGSLSVLGLMNDKDNKVQLLIDKDLLNGERFGCHPCMNTSSLRISMEDLLNKILPTIKHEPIFVELVGE